MILGGAALQRCDKALPLFNLYSTFVIPSRFGAGETGESERGSCLPAYVETAALGCPIGPAASAA
jgi:hypothetical protein